MTPTSVARAAFYAFLVWVPIPLGSNRPVFWVVNAVVVVGIAAVLFFFGRSELPTYAKRSLSLLLLPILALLVWMLAQALPWAPPAWQHAAWQEYGAGGSGAISVNPSATFTAALMFMTIGLAGVVAARIATSRRRSVAIVYAVTVSAVAVAVWGLAALVVDLPPLFGRSATAAGSLTSFFVNRNTTATFLSIGIVASLALAMRRLQSEESADRPVVALMDLPRRAGLLLIVIVLLGIALIATGSRAGIVAGVIGAFATFALGWRRRGWVQQTAFAVALLGIAGAVLLLGTASDFLFARLGQGEIGEEARWDVYLDTVRAILDEPILGHGAGTFADFYPFFHGPDVPGTGIWLQAHNTYLQSAAELGLPAFILVVVALTIIVVRCMRGARRTAEPAALAAGGAAVVVGVHALFDFSLQIEAVAIVFAALLGAGFGVSAARQRRQEAPSAEPEVHRRYQTYGILPESLP